MEDKPSEIQCKTCEKKAEPCISFLAHENATRIKVKQGMYKAE